MASLMYSLSKQEVTRMKKLGLVAAVSMAASAVVLPNAMASDDVSSSPSPSVSSASEESALVAAHAEQAGEGFSCIIFRAQGFSPRKICGGRFYK